MLKSMTSVRIFILDDADDVPYPEQCPLCKQFGGLLLVYKG